jgi:hypothetical protein
MGGTPPPRLRVRLFAWYQCFEIQTLKVFLAQWVHKWRRKPACNTLLLASETVRVSV